MPSKLAGILAAFLLLASSVTLSARVARVQVISRHDVLGGKSFGNTGPYERILGTVYFSLPVDSPHNAGIVDLKNAVNLRNGQVEFSADFIAIRPKDSQRGNGSLLLENPNRGHSRIIALVDGGDWNVENDAGDAWLLRQGFTIVSLGWQVDATGDDALHFHAPIAKENGKTIIRSVANYASPEALKQVIDMGMEAGMAETLDRLEEYVEKMQ